MTCVTFSSVRKEEAAAEEDRSRLQQSHTKLKPHLKAKPVELTYVAMVVFFPSLRGIWENVRPFISRLRFSFLFIYLFILKWRLAHAH